VFQLYIDSFYLTVTTIYPVFTNTMSTTSYDIMTLILCIKQPVISLRLMVVNTNTPIPVKILAPRRLITTRRVRVRRPQAHDGPGGRPVGWHKLSRRLSRRFLVRPVTELKKTNKCTE